MYRFLGFPNRVVVLGLEADDSCEERCKSCDERAVKLRLEWNSNFEMSGKFLVAHSLTIWKFQCCGRFRTGLDLERTEFGLVRPSLSIFDVSCHEFCTGFHFCCMTCLWVLCAETTVICSSVM